MSIGSEASLIPGVFDTGLFVQRLTKKSFTGRPCLFLDRDGVLVEETNYLHRPDDIVFIPGVPAAIAQANRLNLPVVLVTNQAGVGRGLYSWNDFADVQQTIIAHLAMENAQLDLALACAFHAEGVGPFAVADHPWRKPGSGMFHEAARIFDLDLSSSFIVGDTISDLTAGRAAGLCGGALVLTGHGKREAKKAKGVLTEWQSQGDFKAHVAETGAIAIRNWLGSVTAPATVS